MTEHGLVEQPRDLSEATFQSHALSGAGDGRVTPGAPDGTFEVAIARDASAWLELTLGGERIFLPQTAATPDMSLFRFGRSDVQFPTTRTQVAFEILGLRAWHAGDSLQIVSPNAGLTLASPENELAAYPSIGSTTISGQALDWKTTFAPAVDAARGDTTWVTQMVGPTPENKVHYSALARAGIARGFTVTDGHPTTLLATLAPVAQDLRLALHWKGSQFAALAREAGPGARPAPAPALAIRALPDALARSNNFFTSLYTGLPGLVEFGPISGTADLDETVTYGDPFSSQAAGWTEFVTVVYAAPVPVPTPQGIGSLSAMTVAAIPVSSLAATGVLAPPISPVRDARIDGRSLDAPATGVGTSPTLTWQAPSIGAATNYAVVVRAVQASRSGVNLTKLATFYTSSPSLTIPGGVLAAGGSYVLTITAISAAGADLASRPFVGALPYASADHVTAQITP